MISTAGGREIIEDGEDVRDVADVVWGVDEPIPVYFLTDSARGPGVFVVEVRRRLLKLGRVRYCYCFAGLARGS